LRRTQGITQAVGETVFLKLDIASSMGKKNADGDAVDDVRSRNKGTVKGEVLEGPPGSEKSVACVKRSTQELGRPSKLH
jgi:hypothetical protein